MTADSATSHHALCAAGVIPTQPITWETRPVRAPDRIEEAPTPTTLNTQLAFLLGRARSAIPGGPTISIPVFLDGGSAVNLIREDNAQLLQCKRLAEPGLSVTGINCDRSGVITSTRITLALDGRPSDAAPDRKSVV